jgi:hypothetical protein
LRNACESVVSPLLLEHLLAHDGDGLRRVDEVLREFWRRHAIDFRSVFGLGGRDRYLRQGLGFFSGGLGAGGGGGQCEANGNSDMTAGEALETQARQIAARSTPNAVLSRPRALWLSRIGSGLHRCRGGAEAITSLQQRPNLIANHS